MPAVLEQINGMSISEKMKIIEYLVKAVAQAVEKAESRGECLKRDFSRFSGRWSVEEAAAFNAATARSVDSEDWE